MTMDMIKEYLKTSMIVLAVIAGAVGDLTQVFTKLLAMF